MSSEAQQHAMFIEISIALIVGAMMGLIGFYLAKYLRKPVEARIREAMTP